MGYTKEINCYKKEEFSDFNGLDLIEMLKRTDWEVKLFLIDKGNDYDWISLEENKEGQMKFKNILEYKVKNNETIGYSIFNKQVERFVSVAFYNVDNSVCFDLEIGRDENELEWFEWYHQNLIVPIEKQKAVFSKIEWQTGYKFEIIKVIKR